MVYGAFNEIASSAAYWYFSAFFDPWAPQRAV